MRDEPAGVSVADLVAALDAGWGIRARDVRHLPVGAGGYHWSVDGRWFLTVVSQPVERPLRTALALHRDAGLDFVLAPVPTTAGEMQRPLPGGWLLSVFPLVDGVAGDFGPFPDDAARESIVDLLVALHGATPAVLDIAPPATPALPGRAGLADAIRELDRPWTTGPYAEDARSLLAAHAGEVESRLAALENLGARLDRSGWVVTHGEPHPGNILTTAEGPLLIDWDTVRIAPPERDLWLLTATPFEPSPTDEDKAMQRYAAATGRPVSASAVAFYRETWILADIAAYLDDLRRPHSTGGDAADALEYLAANLSTEPPALPV